MSPLAAAAGPAAPGGAQSFRVAVYGSAAEYADLVPRAPDLECVFAKPGADPRDGAGEPAAAFFVIDLDWLGTGADALLDSLGAEPAVHVVATTREPSADVAVGVLKRGARDYLVLPRDRERLTAAIETAHGAWSGAAGAEVADLAPEIVGASRAIRAVRVRVDEAAATADAPVLITGPPGSGKEHVARAIHYRSDRRDRPFVALATAGVPDALLEVELFGLEAGHPGACDLARGGTVFLDEVAELSTPLQDRLRQALEVQRFRRVGGAGESPLRCRVIVASARDLDRAAAAGVFLAELRDRLARFSIRLPPLTEREDDALLLAEHFLAAAARRHGRQPRRLSTEARERVRAAPWPGGVRELRHAIDRVARGAGEGEEIGAAELTPGAADSPPDRRLVIDVPDAGLSFEEYEGRIVRHVLERHGWNRSRAARELGISRPRLLRKIEKYGLRPSGRAL